MRVYISGTIALIIIFALTVFSADTEAASTDQEFLQEVEFVEIPTDRIIVKYKTNADQRGRNAPASDDRMRTLSTTAGIELEYYRAMSGDAHVLRAGDRLSVAEMEKVVAAIETLSDVEFAEPDHIMVPVFVPNDTQYVNQWHYFDTYGINMPTAWDYTTGSSAVKIAVLDTGITDHADLTGRWTGGYDFITDIPTANDGNGRDGDPHDPGNWITSSESASGTFAGCSVTNSTWHGTHVAGIIGAIGNNGSGVTGVNWGSQIVPIRVLGKCGGYVSDIADGMRWAAALTVSSVPENPNPAKVLNISFGGIGVCSSTYQNAIDAVNTTGSIIIVAAGNNSSNLNTNSFQPANCNGVVAIASIDRGGDKAYYSNYGSVVDLSAPGGESLPVTQNGILSTMNNGTTSPGADSYSYLAGTSMAAPLVSGVVSLLLSVDPSLTSAEIMGILQGTARDFPTGSGCTTLTCGSGILDAAAALASLGPPPATATPTKTSTPTATYTSTSTATRTSTAVVIPTNTPTRTPTATNIATSTSTRTSTPTTVPPNTQTRTPTRTATNTVTSIATHTNSLPTFGDVPMSHPYWSDVEILYANGLTAGCSTVSLEFCPDMTMNRAQSAVFMVRGNFGNSYSPPPAPWTTFGDDFSPGTWAQPWAQGMFNAGLTAGCSTIPRLFCPWEEMPRLQAAVFGLRMKYGIAYPPPTGTGTVFADINGSEWYAGWAEQAFAEGMLPACGSEGGKPLFCPNELVSRGLAAYMIVRAKNLSMP